MAVVVLCLFLMVLWVGLQCDCGISWSYSLAFGEYNGYIHVYSQPQAGMKKSLGQNFYRIFYYITTAVNIAVYCLCLCQCNAIA